MTNADIGHRIKNARELNNFTLDDVAKKVGVAKSTIQRYENGKIENIKLPVVESIANALSVNPSWLIGKSDIRQIQQKEPIILTYYNKLNDKGKYEADKRVEELTQIPKYQAEEPVPDHLILRAAHERTDIEVTDEMRKHDDDIMNDPNF